VADLVGPKADLRAALADATAIVSCAHARHIGAVLTAAPERARFVFLGSTRKFTSWPDEHARGVLLGEAAWLASGRPGVLLHPTMIYGASGENNVRRLAALARYLPVLPLPRRGRALVRPIHQDDVTHCVLAALARPWQGPEICVIAGADALSYAAFTEAVARAAGLPVRRVIGMPASPLMAAAWLTRIVPGLPRIDPEEIRRLGEDKSFDIADMRAKLGVEPIGLTEGLARTFRPPKALSGYP
jgi:nucleoside-diphosphate-sugar epimerase